MVFDIATTFYGISTTLQLLYTVDICRYENLESLGKFFVPFVLMIFASYWGSTLVQFSKFNNFHWVCWFLCKTLSNFVYPIWELHNPYCHNVQPKIQTLKFIMILCLGEFAGQRERLKPIGSVCFPLGNLQENMTSLSSFLFQFRWITRGGHLYFSELAFSN